MSNVPEAREALRAAAVRQGVVAAAPRARSAGRLGLRRGRGLLALALVVGLGGTATAAAALGVFSGPSLAPGAPRPPAGTLSGDLEADWPALRGPEEEAPASLQRLFKGGPERGFAPERARQFKTPNGPGWAFPASGRGVCFAVSETPQDGGTPPSWGVGCSSDPSQPGSFRMVDVKPDGTGTAVALVPAGAAAEVQSPEGTRRLKVEDGVVSTTLAAGERLEIVKSGDAPASN